MTEQFIYVDNAGNTRCYKDRAMTILHRDDGQPAVVTANGFCVWYIDGKIHRDGGPAQVDPDGGEWWYQMGKLHRRGGPAIKFPDGEVQYYWNDVRYTPQGYSELMERVTASEVKEEIERKLKKAAEAKKKLGEAIEESEQLAKFDTICMNGKKYFLIPVDKTI